MKCDNATQTQIFLNLYESFLEVFNIIIFIFI